MASPESRSPTLRAASDANDLEKNRDVEAPNEKHNGSQLASSDEKRRRSSWRDGRAENHEKADPFGDEEGEGVKYRTLEWWQCSMIMIAETISLGILSLPSVLATIGMVAGGILIISLGVIATYSGYVIGQFKQRYPWVHNMADAGAVLFAGYGHTTKVIAREIFGAAQVIFLIFSMASHILTWTICFSTITSGATCTLVWGVIGLIVFWLFDLPRTLKKVSWLSVASFISILSAIFIAMIGVGVSNPAAATGGFHATESASFPEAFLAVTNIVFAFAGHVAFFSFISEMKNPADFPKALVTLQVADTGLYFVVAMVIYAYGGTMVDSPALGTAGDVVGKVAWGMAVPTIIIAGIIYGHVAAKYIYVRLFRGTKHMADRGLTSLGSWTWLAITGTLWVIAWIIAESIPDFNDLLALISSLFAAWFTYGLSGIFWLFLNKGGWTRDWKKTSLCVVNWGLVLMGAAICGIGLYASGLSISEETGSASWTCKSNGQ